MKVGGASYLFAIGIGFGELVVEFLSNLNGISLSAVMLRRIMVSVDGLLVRQNILASSRLSGRTVRGVSSRATQVERRL